MLTRNRSESWRRDKPELSNPPSCMGRFGAFDDGLDRSAMGGPSAKTCLSELKNTVRWNCFPCEKMRLFSLVKSVGFAP